MIYVYGWNKSWTVQKVFDNCYFTFKWFVFKQQLKFFVCEWSGEFPASPSLCSHHLTQGFDCKVTQWQFSASRLACWILKVCHNITGWSESERRIFGLFKIHTNIIFFRRWRDTIFHTEIICCITVWKTRGTAWASSPSCIRGLTAVKKSIQNKSNRSHFSKNIHIISCSSILAYDQMIWNTISNRTPYSITVMPNHLCVVTTGWSWTRITSECIVDFLQNNIFKNVSSDQKLASETVFIFYNRLFWHLTSQNNSTAQISHKIYIVTYRYFTARLQQQIIPKLVISHDWVP